MTTDIFGQPVAEIARQDGVPSHYHDGQGWYANAQCQCPSSDRPDNPSATTLVTILYKRADSGMLRSWQDRVATDDMRFAILRAGAEFYRQYPVVTLVKITTQTA